MHYLSTIAAVLTSIFKARARGGRIKRLLTFVCSFCLFVGTIVIIQQWTKIPISKHVLVFDHPITTDTAKNHYIGVDVRIRSNEGFSFNSNAKRLVFDESFRVWTDHRLKDKATSLPECHDPLQFNYYVGQEIFTGDSVNTEGKYLAKELDNLLVIGHYFNADISEYTTTVPFRGWNYSPYVSGADTIESHSLILADDSKSLSLPLGQKYHKEICKTANIFYGNIRFNWFYLMWEDDPDPIIQEGLSNIDKTPWDFLYLFKMHDISRTYYDFVIMNKSVDQINLTFETTELAEFSKTFADKERQNAKSITASFTGHNLNYPPTYIQKTSFSFCTKNLESSNAQAVRLFFLMTLSSLALVAFLRSLADYVWIIIRKIQKRSRYE